MHNKGCDTVFMIMPFFCGGRHSVVICTYVTWHQSVTRGKSHPCHQISSTRNGKRGCCVCNVLTSSQSSQNTFRLHQFHFLFLPYSTSIFLLNKLRAWSVFAVAGKSMPVSFHIWHRGGSTENNGGSSKDFFFSALYIRTTCCTVLHISMSRKQNRKTESPRFSVSLYQKKN